MRKKYSYQNIYWFLEFQYLLQMVIHCFVVLNIQKKNKKTNIQGYINMSTSFVNESFIKSCLCQQDLLAAWLWIMFWNLPKWSVENRCRHIYTCQYWLLWWSENCSNNLTLFKWKTSHQPWQEKHFAQQSHLLSVNGWNPFSFMSV